MAKDYSDRFEGEENPNYQHGLAYDREYRNKWRREYLADNPEKRREYNRRIKAKRKGAEGRHTRRDIRRLKHHQNMKCATCGACLKDKGYHVGHILPIAEGGSNYPGNIQLLCPSCNLKKKDMLMIEYRVYELDKGDPLNIDY